MFGVVVVSRSEVNAIVKLSNFDCLTKQVFTFYNESKQGSGANILNLVERNKFYKSTTSVFQPRFQREGRRVTFGNEVVKFSNLCPLI